MIPRPKIQPCTATASRRCGRIPFTLVFLLSLTLAAESFGQCPDLLITFRLYTLDRDTGEETLRWVGRPGTGPFPDSPEVVPQVGFGVPFRIDWEGESCAVGYKFIASQRGENWRPLDEFGRPFFAGVRSFYFANDTPEEELGDVDCPTGWSDCPERLRFESGEYELLVISTNDQGWTTRLPDGSLYFRVNYQPILEIVDDHAPAQPCAEDLRYPYYVDPASGAICTFGDGDELPVGVTANFLLQAIDTIEANRALLPEGTPCCDEVLDPAYRFRYQWRIADARTVDELGRNIFWNTLFNPPTESPTVSLVVEEYDYTLDFRTVDEHGLRSTSVGPVRFKGVAMSVPVLASGITAREYGSGVLLRWHMAEGAKGLQVAVQRSVEDQRPKIVGTIPASAGPMEFLDTRPIKAEGRELRYELHSLHADGTRERLGAETRITLRRSERISAQLHQNYPNPFNPSTVLSYGLAQEAHVNLRVYDVAGQLVKELVDAERPAGRHEAHWDGRDASGSRVASGIYLGRLEAGRAKQTIRMVLLK